MSVFQQHVDVNKYENYWHRILFSATLMQISIWTTGIVSFFLQHVDVNKYVNYRYRELVLSNMLMQTNI